MKKKEERGYDLRIVEPSFFKNQDCNGCGREVDVNLIKKMNY